MEIIIKFILCYLIGSISGSMIVGKLKNIDIRTMGSGNAGGTNAYRIMGKKFAIMVVFIDIIKGFIAVTFVPQFNFLNIGIIDLNTEILTIICGIGAY